MAVDKDKMQKLKQYASASTKKVYALRSWININMKQFGLADALSCIYDYAGGKQSAMDDIIAQLTEKRKVYGRTQVYNADNVKMIDIVKNPDGTLTLRGYNPEHEYAPKGQHMPQNNRIFRKSDSQTSKTYQNAVERMYDLGSVVREMYPNEDKAYIQFAMDAIRRYASDKKLNAIGVANAIKKGRLVLDGEGPRFIVRLPVRESVGGRVVVLSEDAARRVQEKLKMTEYKFNSAVKSFLSELLADPVNAQPADILVDNHITRGKLLRYLLSNGIVEKDERIVDKDENGQPKTATMMVKYRVPKKRFEAKLKNLYIRLFEKNVPVKEDAGITSRFREQIDTALASPTTMGFAAPADHTQSILAADVYNHKINEDGEGATSADASGQFSQPLFPMMRRQMPTNVQETATGDVGDYQYTVPFPGDEETLARHNGKGGSVSINRME